MAEWVSAAAAVKQQSPFGADVALASQSPAPLPWQMGLAQRARAVFTTSGNPDHLQLFGRVAASLAILAVCVSLLAIRWSYGWYWEAGLLLLIFVLCEGQAGIWRALERRTSSPSSLPMRDSTEGQTQ
jgi:hypothetical protein